MDEVAEEVPLIVDGVVDAEQVFAHVGRNFARGRSQLIGWLVGRSGNILERIEEQSVGIEQRTRNGVIRERLAWRQSGSRQLGIESRIGGGRNKNLVADACCHLRAGVERRKHVVEVGAEVTRSAAGILLMGEGELPLISLRHSSL